MSIFDVNSDYFIERETIEDHGYEFQIRELRKINEYEAKCTIYIWAPDGHEFDEVPDQFYEDPITWKSSLFGENFPDIVFTDIITKRDGQVYTEPQKFLLTFGVHFIC